MKQLLTTLLLAFIVSAKSFAQSNPAKVRTVTKPDTIAAKRILSPDSVKISVAELNELYRQLKQAYENVDAAAAYRALMQKSAIDQLGQKIFALPKQPIPPKK